MVIKLAGISWLLGFVITFAYAPQLAATRFSLGWGLARGDLGSAFTGGALYTLTGVGWFLWPLIIGSVIAGFAFSCWVWVQLLIWAWPGDRHHG
ncbi:MAG: hypothetical protein ACYDEB_08700 [Dehalococcoidia bacterium]